MGIFGYTYGSEWHLLRLLACHRDDLDRRIEAVIPGGRIVRWLDHAYAPSDGVVPDRGCAPRTPGEVGRPPRPRRLDVELKGLEFLDPGTRSRLQGDWAGYWPQQGNVPNWDAVGQIEIGGITHWLLVEAKSHLAEIESACGAEPQGPGEAKILAALEQTAHSIGSDVDVRRWLRPYYQFANRLAVVDFLRRSAVPAVALNVYFLGDRFPESDRVVCPAGAREWEPTLEAMYAHVGWSGTAGNRLGSLVHRAFIPVHGRD